jgi:endonuclease V-like protein UPF0215 family
MSKPIKSSIEINKFDKTKQCSFAGYNYTGIDKDYDHTSWIVIVNNSDRERDEQISKFNKNKVRAIDLKTALKIIDADENDNLLIKRIGLNLWQLVKEE